MGRYLAVIGGALVAALSLSSCGVVNPDPATAERRPAATVSGVGYDAQIAYGLVRVYAYKDGIKGAELATGTSDDAGHYTLSLVAEDQPVLIEITGGHYKEEATGRTVNLKDGQALRAVTFYKSGQAINVMLTALTNLQAAMVEYKVKKGTNIGNAIAESASAISTLLNFDVLATEPLDITDQANASMTVSNGHLAGFYAAAMSSWTKWVSEQNGSVAHSIYNSIALAQLMYRDLASDGVLDGKASGSPLGLGLVPLSQDTYRQAFARHLLSMASDPANKTGITTDQLLAAASQLAGNTHPMFGSQPPTPLDDVGPEITGIEPAGVYHAGVFTYAVTVRDFVGVQTVVFSLDGTKLDNAANVKAPQITINSALPMYGDGAHKLTVSATDFLGNNAQRDFTVLFDNSAPHIAVTSRPVTNKAVFSLAGTYTDSGAGIASIKAQGHDATVAGGVWSVDVALKRGVNTIQIMLTDNVGNAYQTDTIVAMDITPPGFVIGAHSLAKFSKGDGTYFIDKLHSENGSIPPLYIPVSKVSLNGTLIDPNALNTAEIPYFTFLVGDRDDNGVLTPAKDLIVRLQYEHRGNIVTPWHILPSLRGNGVDYYIPIATESMAPGWESTAFDAHILNVEVEDLAGNISQQTFSFFADIVVPPVAITATDLGAALFKATPFDKRGDLQNRSITTTDYSFTNDTGAGLLISIADGSRHSVTNTVDVAVREHLIKDVATTEWYVKGVASSTINYAASSCTQSFDEKAVTSILNWNGTALVNIDVPAPVLSAPHSISNDTYPILLPTPWSDVPHIDNNLFSYSSKTTTVGSGVQGEDYYFFTSAGLRVPAFFQNSFPSTCPSTANWSYFKQRTVFSYVSATGYPRNNYTSQVESANFQTGAFVVTDANSAVIPSVGGYYRIPAGAVIHIKKSVTTPSMAMYNDLDVANATTFGSYTAHKLDKTLVWTIDNNLVVKAALDLGYGNASAMSATPSTVVGKVNYTVGR